MKLELTSYEAEFLHEQLEHQLARLGAEQAHTENNALKRALAEDIDSLQLLIDRLSALNRPQAAEGSEAWGPP